MVIAGVLLILIWVPGLGVVRGGARRWVRLGPVLAEPSELVKFAVVFFLADFLAKRQDLMADFKHGPLPAFLIVGPIALLVLKQPDFGTTVMLALILFAMLFAAGARAKHLGAAGRPCARRPRSSSRSKTLPSAPARPHFSIPGNPRAAPASS